MRQHRPSARRKRRGSRGVARGTQLARVEAMMTAQTNPESLSDTQLDRELLALRLEVHGDKIRALELLEEYRRRQRMCELN
jgi:hypothetical protein